MNVAEEQAGFQSHAELDNLQVYVFGLWYEAGDIVTGMVCDVCGNE